MLWRFRDESTYVHMCVCVCVCSKFEMHKWFEKNRRGMNLGRERTNLGKI